MPKLMLNSSAVFCSFVKPWRDWTGKTEKQLLLVNIFFTNRKIYLATNNPVFRRWKGLAN